MNSQKIITNKRNANIELLRFLFAFGIVLLHCESNALKYVGGYLGVEFFFMISGAYLVGNIQKFNNEKNFNDNFFGKIILTFSYTLHKIFKIYPQYILSNIAAVIIYVFLIKQQKIEMIVVSLISDLFFFQVLGVDSISLTGIVWFLGALFYSVLIMTFVIVNTKYDGKKISALCLIFIGASLFLLMKTKFSFMQPNTYGSIFGIKYNTGILRGIISINLGIIASYLSKKIIKSDRKSNRIFLTISEFVCYGIAFWYMKNCGDSFSDIFIVLAIFAGVTITLSQKSFFAHKFDCNVIYKLGNFSSFWFMNHCCLVSWRKQVFETLKLSFLNDTYKTLLSILFSVLLTLTVKYVYDLFIKIKKQTIQSRLKIAE